MKKPEDERLDRWTRPPLERDGPIRVAQGIYRSAEKGPDEPGVAEDAVVAAVRMAYKVAQASIARSTRLSQRLRKAGDRAAGPRSTRQAADASQELVAGTMMRALSWFEALMADESRLKRMSTAQFQLIGSMLGLSPDLRASSAGAAPVGTEPAESSDTKTWHSHAGDRNVKIVLKEKGRPVRVCHLELATRKPIEPTQIYFYSVSDIKCGPLEAAFSMDVAGEATLTLSTQSLESLGRWRAAVCGATGEQLGVVEIEL
jgi:hypothetical protein